MIKRMFALILVAVVINVCAQTVIPQWEIKDDIKASDDYKVSVKTENDNKWQEVPVLSCEVNLVHHAMASFAEFEMKSRVIVRVEDKRGTVDKVLIRPSSRHIVANKIDAHTIEFILNKAEYLSVEFNGDRQHNLHLFANPEMKEKHTENESGTIDWRGKNAQDVFVKNARLIYFAPGIHKPKDLPGGDIRIPSNCTVYLALGAIVKARLIVDHAENVRIIGHGIICHSLRGIEITHSKNVTVDGPTFLNPQHYTIFGGQSDSIVIRNIKSFSSRSWSDGIDLMCCRNVKIDNVFLRTSDDCIALYNHRWWYWGGSENFDISHATLWADVAHPVNVGSHGDDRSMIGEKLQNAYFHDCDILYAKTNSALNFSCGDKNYISDVTFDDIRIEDMDSTALIGMRVVFGDKYNRAPGNSISNILFNNICFKGDDSLLKQSFMQSYDAKHIIENVRLNNVTVNGKSLTFSDIKKDDNIKNVTVSTEENRHHLIVDTKNKSIKVQPTMYGVFFEDINYGADGGLYAEMVENRSFEFPEATMGWNIYGKVSLSDSLPAFSRNPHFVILRDAGHFEKRTGIENHGFFGMGLKQDSIYMVSFYARLHEDDGKESKIDINLADEHNVVVGNAQISVDAHSWTKYTINIKSDVTTQKGCLRLFLTNKDAVDIDYVSMFPTDNWNGLRTDMVKVLADLHPGVLRFPGGCIVEGTDLATRYQWKNTIGDVENRPLNENRWNYTFAHRMSPNYYQTTGLGFYEYFLLAEKIGADPLPILNCGMACQYQNKDNDPKGHVAIDKLQPYIQDALDLVEFANGDVSTKWGKLRAEMGHPTSFHLHQIGIGNEQWGELYMEHLKHFVTALRAKYPKIKIVGSAGPQPSDGRFKYAWDKQKKIKIDLIDEHYYKDSKWFLDNAGRYDIYDRKRPKVFAGEYACHTENRANSYEAALAEAAFMTGLERNADVVYQATYAPLFSHVDGWQWKPDLVWFDNLKCLRTVNYYVQQLYAANRGTNVVSVLEDGKILQGHDSIYASAVYDSRQKCYIVKLVSVLSERSLVDIKMNGIKNITSCEQITLHSDDITVENTMERPYTIVPKTVKIKTEENIINASIPAKAFVLYKIFTK